MISQHAKVIDLHGLDSNYASILFKDFILDHYKLRNKYLSIIHGRGQGILRKRIHEDLKRNKLVKEYKLNMFNDGETLVVLDLK